MRESSVLEGLSSNAVLSQRGKDGFNELPVSRRRRFHEIGVDVLREPMVFLLLACGAIYFLLGDAQEAFLLVGFLVLIVGITLFQEAKAEKALEALRELSSPRALVLRDGIRKRIPGREVVRGDIVFVNEGDRVPADGTLVLGAHVSADESLLTGESIPLEKDPGEELHAGTTIVRGQAVMRVTRTGVFSELGKIGKSIETLTREPTRLERQTRILVRKLAWIAAGLCVLVIVLYGLTRRDWLGGFLAGLSLAMAILPNELPAVLTIFLALGAWRISQRRVLTRKMTAIENLGAATVLCVDKTGTLTQNRMAVRKLWSAAKTLDLSFLREGTLPEEFHEVLEYGILASREDPFDPMERAFLSAGAEFLSGTEHLHGDWSLEREYPLSSELLAISHVWKPERRGAEEPRYVVGAKGAPEAIVDLCHLSQGQAREVSESAAGMARDGYRVLGVAKALTKAGPLPTIQHDFEFVFLGLVGLADPIRAEVPRAIAECRGAGVRVVMITGDHPDTARSIGRQIGLENQADVMTGGEIDRMDDSALAHAIRRIDIFSRTKPEQKLRIVRALKSLGEIVAMTGDGVNDAPALKSADIGIAMGGRGTDVARESAAIVLLDDDFASIVEAIRTGRRVFWNLRKAFAYLLAVHVPIAGMSILPVALKLPLVLLPIHIAFLHLIIEPTSSIAFEAEPAHPRLMQLPPRDPAAPVYGGGFFLRSVFQGAMVLAALLVLFVVALRRGQGEVDARTLTFTALIIANLSLIFASRGGGKGRNRVTSWIIVSSVALLAVVLYLPVSRELFRFSTLHPIDWVICLVLGAGSVGIARLVMSSRS